MDIELLQEISRRLGVLISLLAVQNSERGSLSMREQVRVLDSYGLKPVEIAKVLNKTQNHVNKELTLIRKARK